MKMDFNSISRQKAWMRGIQFKVESVGEPQETQYGFCQAITATDDRGMTECLNYFFEFIEAAVDPSEIGEQFYDVKWDAKKQLYKCIPSTPPVKNELKPDRPDWEKINLGKCRHGILCALIQAGSYQPYMLLRDEAQLDAINKLAEFSMFGKISLDNDNEV